MEYLTATANDTIQKCNKIWELWYLTEYGFSLLWYIAYYSETEKIVLTKCDKKII